jgi:3-methyladenine DNA glycosylase/8-oxoguanine DNA glycosylase
MARATTPASPTATADTTTGTTTGAWHDLDAPRSLRRTLSPYRYGVGDPTTRLSPGRFVRATLTPDGPATLLLRWDADPAPVDRDGLTADAWGPGADWLLGRVDRLTGAHDRAVAFARIDSPADATVDRALRATRTSRIGASGSLYHELLPTVLGQRITGGEAVRQWARLVRRLGEPAPGPPGVVGDLRLPPPPATLDRRPLWWFHPLGIEQKRARPLVELARHPAKLFEWADAPSDTVAGKLSLVPGIGPWTIGSVLGPALGDPDAVATGDYHFPHAVAWALAGEARADDDRMLQLLEPYRGQRGRVLAAVIRTFGGAPKFGPRQRILPMAQW